MCNKDILQLSSEDLNRSMSPLKISYHYISSVTVSSSNRHPVCASCILPRHVLLGHLDPWRWDQLASLKRWNGITTSCCAQFQKIAGLKTCSISVSFRQENAKWWNIQGVSRLVDITAGDFVGRCDQKNSYKHVSNFGRLWSYDRLKLRIEGNDWQ